MRATSQPPPAVSGVRVIDLTLTLQPGMRGVQIDPAAIGDDRDMLEDLVAAAVNDAVHRVEARVQEKFSGLMGGMKLPPGFKLPL